MGRLFYWACCRICTIDGIGRQLVCIEPSRPCTPADRSLVAFGFDGMHGPALAAVAVDQYAVAAAWCDVRSIAVVLDQTASHLVGDVLRHGCDRRAGGRHLRRCCGNRRRRRGGLRQHRRGWCSGDIGACRSDARARRAHHRQENHHRSFHTSPLSAFRREQLEPFSAARPLHYARMAAWEKRCGMVPLLVPNPHGSLSPPLRIARSTLADAEHT